MMGDYEAVEKETACEKIWDKKGFHNSNPPHFKSRSKKSVSTAAKSIHASKVFNSEGTRSV
jgi:hypothetical protein